MTLTVEELRNLLVLLNRAPLTGAESIGVALLIQKIMAMAGQAAPQAAPAT